MSTVSDNTGSLPVECELLCFVREKTKVDDIAKLCHDFYREDEIFAAKNLLEQVLPYRLNKQSGTNKCRSPIDDIIKACLDPSVSLPVYYTTELSRLPPVDASHCDVSLPC